MPNFKKLVQKLLNVLINKLGAFSKNWKFSRLELKKILVNWNITKFIPKMIKMGSSKYNWVIQTPDSKYILSNTGKNWEYLQFQILIVNHLAETDFMYAIPVPLKPNGADCVQYQGDSWILYKFIEGHSLNSLPTVTQAQEIGVLVANYHTATQKVANMIDQEYLESWTLPTFDDIFIDSIIQESVSLWSLNKSDDPLINLFLKRANIILREYKKISIEDREAIKKLPKIPIYHDWHVNNILMQDDEIVGLIDFDSLTIGNKLIDFQNALSYLSASCMGVDITRMQAFMQGYFSVLKISQRELTLIYAVMIERLTWLICYLLENRKVTKSRDKDNNIIANINLLRWLIINKNVFEYYLYIASSGMIQSSNAVTKNNQFRQKNE